MTVEDFGTGVTGKYGWISEILVALYKRFTYYIYEKGPVETQRIMKGQLEEMRYERCKEMFLCSSQLKSGP